jgi:hypothetical protein
LSQNKEIALTSGDQLYEQSITSDDLLSAVSSADTHYCGHHPLQLGGGRLADIFNVNSTTCSLGIAYSSSPSSSSSGHTKLNSAPTATAASVPSRYVYACSPFLVFLWLTRIQSITFETNTYI